MTSDPSTALLALAAAILLAVVALGLALVAGGRWLRRSHGRLLAAVELSQRQLTELRTVADDLRARVEGIEERLATRVEPELVRLGRHLEIEETAAEVRRAAAGGRLAAGVAERLLERLAALDEEIAAGGRPS